MVDCYILLIEVKDAAKHIGQSLTTRNYLDPNVNSSEVESPWKEKGKSLTVKLKAMHAMIELGIGFHKSLEKEKEFRVLD